MCMGIHKVTMFTLQYTKITGFSTLERFSLAIQQHTSNNVYARIEFSLYTERLFSPRFSRHTHSMALCVGNHYLVLLLLLLLLLLSVRARLVAVALLCYVSFRFVPFAIRHSVNSGNGIVARWQKLSSSSEIARQADIVTEPPNVGEWMHTMYFTCCSNRLVSRFVQVLCYAYPNGCCCFVRVFSLTFLLTFFSFRKLCLFWVYAHSVSQAVRSA